MAQSAEQIVVTGGWPLNGTVRVPAAKNSVLPLLAAALLCQRPVRLRGVPRLSDVECSLALLRGAGCTAQWQGSDVALSGSPVQSTLPGQTAAQMRASILFCAPLLARLGRAETVLPGGCRIGSRPIDLHLTGLARMGVQELDAGPGRLVLLAPSGLHGAEITLRFPSVGATETLLLAAACARGRTVLRGAAREPEVADLADFLNRCGGSVEGAGSSTLIIEGRRALGGCVFSPLPDRIFASTLACAAAAAGGRVELTGCSRQKSCAVNLVLIIVLSLPCVLGYNVWNWKGFSIFGGSVLDLEDFLVSNLFLPLGSLVHLLFCTSRYGWGWKNYTTEANTGKGLKIKNWMRGYITYILPLIVLFIFGFGIYDKFFTN